MQKKANLITLIYGVCFSVTSLLVATLLILQVLDIYLNGGASPYTVTNIKQHFNSISIIIYLWILIIIAGFVIYIIFPTKEKAKKQDDFYAYEIAKKKLENKEVPQNETAIKHNKFNLITVILKIICGVAVGVSVVFSLAYLLNTSNFLNVNQNAEVLKASLYLLPFVLVSFGLIIAVTAFEKLTIKAQIKRVKELVANSTSSEIVKQTFKQKIIAFFDKDSVINGIRIAVAVISITLIIFGLANGGTAGVLSKAITICRQCIGLG